MDDEDRNLALISMISLGLFADTPALDRWSRTEEAVPVLTKWLELRRAPMPDELFYLDIEAEDAAFEADKILMADIEQRFGQKRIAPWQIGSMTTATAWRKPRR